MFDIGCGYRVPKNESRTRKLHKKEGERFLLLAVWPPNAQGTPLPPEFISGRFPMSCREMILMTKPRPRCYALGMDTKDKRNSHQKKALHGKKWSARVTRSSDAMDVEKGVLKSDDPKKIATSVKNSSIKSSRRKTNLYKSAVSLISFYENRGGKNLSAGKKRTLKQAKQELKHAFGRDKR
jgi:hypothetical protein